jgi:hypothetical protein
MIANCIQSDIPTLDRVAAFAIGAELAAMNVSMTIGAVCTGVFEEEACMALGAAYFLMHPMQGITSLVVIKLRLRPDWRPTGIRMAVLAGNG